MSEQMTLFDKKPSFTELADAGTFEGPDQEEHVVRLRGQIKRIFECVKDGRWRTLADIARETGDPITSVSAQLRHLRKERFGAHTVERRHDGDGLYSYRVLVSRTDL